MASVLVAENIFQHQELAERKQAFNERLARVISMQESTQSTLISLSEHTGTKKEHTEA